jgi:DNA-binding response OmpR family regulator
MKLRILVAAENLPLRAQLARWLISAGYAVELAEGPKRIREVLAGETIALAIVAVDQIGGSDLAQEIAGQVDRLILVTDSADRAQPSIAGGVTRLAQPLTEEEVIACVTAAIPPAGQEMSGAEILQFAGYTLDAAGRICRNANAKEVPLTRAEFSLLLTLARRAGRVVLRDELSQAVTGRGASPDSRSIDVLTSRLRGKIEADPKTPRLIVTVPGEGYRFTPTPQILLPESVARLPATPQILDARAGRPALLSLSALLVSAIAALAGAVAAIVIVSAGLFTKPTPVSAIIEKFDASLVPFVLDSVRTDFASYPSRPDHKALAISTGRFGIAFGAASQEAAQKEALDRCKARAAIRSETPCRIYATGMDVVWSRKSLPMPLPADFHADPLATRILPDEVLAWLPSQRPVLNGYLQGRGPKALAIAASDRTLHWASAFDSEASVARVIVERCGDAYQTPCLLLAVNEFLTVQLPTSRRIADVFMLATEAEMSEDEKRRVAEVYAQKDWRALARGKSGGWYPVANAPTESAAVEAASALCAQHDRDCRIYAVSNFRVADEDAGPATTAAPAVEKFDATVVPFVSDKDRGELATYADRRGFRPWFSRRAAGVSPLTLKTKALRSGRR